MPEDSSLLPPEPDGSTIPELFAEQVRRVPDRIALVFEETQMSYRELDERSDRLSACLLASGVGPDDLVGICMERSADLVLGILSILKAGGAYVPIDPDYPPGRINYMLDDTEVSIVLCHSASRDRLPQKSSVSFIGLEELWKTGSQWDKMAQGVKADLKAGPRSLAYVMYTSGSTGRPKGVLIEHRSVVSLVRGIDYITWTERDVLLSTGSPSFDATTFEYWGMLLNGGRLVMCRETTLLDNVRLREEIERHGVNKMWFTVGLFNQLAEMDIRLFDKLETILVGGDRLSEEHIRKLRSVNHGIEIINGYGPTENTTFSLTYRIGEVERGAAIPIGFPLTDRQVYIVDSNGAFCPIGVVGEILVGGAGLARGYWRQEALTAERFVWILPGGPSSGHEDFPEGAKVRVYRTGDLGRWLPDGTIGYMGRSDDQVKIRGYRVEPAEVERVMEGCPEVRQAVVLAREDGTGVKRLIGYVVPREQMDRGGILSWLRDRLPEYMVPSVLVELDNLPLNNNGKVDKQGLPPVDWNSLPALSAAYEAPRSETEQKLSEIWAGLLGLERVGVRDDFFALGGHSLSATRIVSAMRKEMEVEVGIRSLFQFSTIELLAKYIEINKNNVQDDPDDDMIIAI